MEAVEAARIGHELRSLRLEYVPDRLPGQLWMMMRFGVGNASVEQPGVHLVIALEPQSRREEALAHEPNLVLDLPLLPARCRRAGDRFDEVMTAHLQEAAIVEAVLADEDRVYRGLHVVVDAASTGPLEQREGTVVGIEHHLLRLARIGAHEQHPAVAEPDVGDLHGHRYAVKQDDLVAPVELVGFPGRKTQRHIRSGRRLTSILGPSSGVAANRIVAAIVAAIPQLLEHPDQRQTFTRRLRVIGQQQLIERVAPSANLGERLIFSVVAKLRRARADHLPHDLPRYTKIPTDRFYCLPLYEKRPTNLRNCLHDQHPNLAPTNHGSQCGPIYSGVPIGCRSPPKGGPFCMPIHMQRLTATGGWGFAHFQDGKPGDEAFMKTCFPCHNEVKARDLVFGPVAG